MWTYDLITEDWSPEKMNGVVPNQRSGYASCVDGDRIYLFGGEGNNQLLQDFHIFDTNSLEWTEFTGVEWPPARKNACMACSFPYLAIYGGSTVNGYNGDLYYIDLRYKTVKLLSTSSDSGSPGILAHAECWATSTTTNGIRDTLTIAIGESTGETSLDGIFQFSLQTSSWSRLGTTESRSQAAGIMTADRILFAGGERWGFVAYTEVFTYDIISKKSTILGHLPGAYYNGGSAYVKSSLYLHGGADNTSKKFRPAVPSSNFLRLEMNENCDSTGCDWPCSPGTYKLDSGLCEFCPKGTYKIEFGSGPCLKCEIGTASKTIGNTSKRQCYPCREGFYSPVEGASMCSMCPNGFLCSIGNSMPLAYDNIEEGVISKQPKSYSDSSDQANSLNSGFQYGMLIICAAFICTFIGIKQKRYLFKKLDLYTKNHNHFIGEIMYVKARAAGGLFSVLFLLLALIFIFTTIVNYREDNIQESKALVPLVTLEEEYSNVIPMQIEGDIIVKLSFNNYGGNCEEKDGRCASDIDILSYQFNGNSAVTCKQIEKTCDVEWVCNNCIIKTGAFIQYEMQQRESYADAIMANVTSSSSIPDEFSSILQTITAEFDKVYRGSEVNQLFFEMTPSVSCT